MIKVDKVLELLGLLEFSNVRYCVLRDFFQNGSVSGDVDILFHPADKQVLHSILKKEKWFKVLHPYDNLTDFSFLYGMDEFEFFAKGELRLDICFQLCCRSIDKKYWLPLDLAIQESVFDDRVRYRDYYKLSKEDELVHLTTRCVFDKRQFPLNYKERIVEIYPECDKSRLKEKLSFVYFNAFHLVIDAVESNNFDCLISKYLSYCEY
jgi:hypothetical protein